MFRRYFTSLLGSCKAGFDATLNSRLFHASLIVSKESSGRYSTPNVKQLPVKVQERLHLAEDRHSFIPNFFRVYARRPKEFMAFYEYHDALMNGNSSNLTRAEKEMIALVASARQKCLYCAIVHGGLHRRHSKRPDQAEQLIANWKHADISDREKAILAFSEALSRMEDMSDERFKSLEVHGLNEEDAWDIAGVVALTAMSGYMAHLLGVRANQEFFKMGKNWKK